MSFFKFYGKSEVQHIYKIISKPLKSDQPLRKKDTKNTKFDTLLLFFEIA